MYRNSTSCTMWKYDEYEAMRLRPTSSQRIPAHFIWNISCVVSVRSIVLKFVVFIVKKIAENGRWRAENSWYSTTIFGLSRWWGLYHQDYVCFAIGCLCCWATSFFFVCAMVTFRNIFLFRRTKGRTWLWSKTWLVRNQSVWSST